jgi:hypothetical protein
MEQAESARRSLIETLCALGLFPGLPTPMTTIGVDVDTSFPGSHLIRCVFPVTEDISGVPQEVNGVRVIVVQEDRRWIASAL